MRYYYFSDENRFVTGSKNGYVTVLNDSTPKSRKVFNQSEQWRNATLVRYANNKIFATGYAKLHILDLELETYKVVDHEFNDISVLAASDNYVAIGDWDRHVNIFNHNGDRVLVSDF